MTDPYEDLPPRRRTAATYALPALAALLLVRESRLATIPEPAAR